MKLYWGPHTCAIGIHVLLEEIGKPYEAEKVDVSGGETRKPAFKAINPKGKVPVLVRDDGSTLTEFAAIATWLARTHPDKHLLPYETEAEVRALEIMDYAVGTVHGQGFGRIFMPKKFEPDDVVHGTLGLGSSSVKEQGKAMVRDGFAILDRQLAGKSYAGGDHVTIADAALFYIERWAPEAGVELPPNLAAHFRRMKARPAVQRALRAEGEAAD
jgi:glutathione S-transferase